MNTLRSTLNNTINSTNNNKLKDNIDSSAKTLSTLKKAMNFGVIYAGLRKGWNIVKDVAGANIDMIETNNLFEVSMGKVVNQYGNLDEAQSQYYTKAMKFQNEMNEKLATNKKELMNYQAMYYSMFNSQLGSKNKDKSYFMSENLTKAGYDIASLYNLSVEEAMSKIKSGIAGQVEPLRTIGIDISESSLTKVIQDAGITDRSVQQLSYAEKEVARYIAIVEQAKQAQGDFAKTFEQPANQIKVFQNQLAELRQVAGAFIVNVFGNILVYVNAIIMVVKEILKSFASLFGYDLNTGGADLSTTTGVDDLNSGLGSAIKKAKELKKQLMGFDEINNIDPASQTGGGSGGGGASGGIDDKLLNSLKEWDNMMGSISGKAQEIRDKILDWLGVTDGSYKNLKRIWDAVVAIGIAIASWKISSSILKFLNTLGLIKNLSAALRIAAGVSIALGGAWLIYKGIKQAIDDGGLTSESILRILSGGLIVGAGLSLAFKKITPLRIAAGITLALGSVLLEYNGIKKLLSGDLSTKTLLELLGGSAGLGVSTFLLTKNIKLALIVTAFSLSFDVGLAIGQWINNNFGDSYDWYLKKFNVHLEDGVDFTDILGIIGTMLGTIGDVILDGLGKLWNLLPENVQEGITKAFRTALAVVTFGLSEIIIQLVTHWDDVKKAFENGWNAIVDFFTVAIPSWWNEKVAPWFTIEKWQGIAQDAVDGIKNKFNEWKEKFKPIEDWWNDKIAPWFTKEKWKEVANNAKTGIENKFNEWKNNFNPISDWWNNKIKPWFTWDKWRQLGQDALNGLQNCFSNFKLSFKLPHFSWTSQPASGWMSSVLSALNLPTSLPKLNVNWYANGGMPDMGEIFVAREKGPEMVGKIGNKTTVANNNQIVTAIKQGVYEAVTSAMTNGSNEVYLNVRTEEGVIVEKVSQGFAEHVMQTGELPFPVPV